MNTNRQLLIDFAKFIAKDEMYSHNENCFTIPGGKTFTSEQLADAFLSTLPSDSGSKQEEGEPRVSDCPLCTGINGIHEADCPAYLHGEIPNKKR